MSGETHTTDATTATAPAPALLAVAARELRAAQAIVLDPACDDALAAPHLTTAWQALALATRADAPADASAPPSTIATWPEGQPAPAATGPGGLAPRREDRDALPAGHAAAIDAVLPALLAARGRSPLDPAPWTVPHAVLERHCDALARILARHQRPLHRDPVWRRRAALGAAGLALLVLALRPWQAEDLGPWAGTYFNRMDFSGARIARRDLDLRFDWGERSPMDAIPIDRFSVRWETCLDLPASAAVAFQLVSDDSSRLFIDDALALDNWGKHAVESRGATVDLTPGPHHLRVDYVEHSDEASVALLASFAGEPPAAIPRRLLRAPADDEDSPCGD